MYIAYLKVYDDIFGLYCDCQMKSERPWANHATDANKYAGLANVRPDDCRIRCLRIKKMILVGAAGFEPATLWSQTRCATRLRHAP